MQLKNPWKKKISEHLKVLWVLEVLLLVTIQGCMSAPVKRRVEVWLVNSKEAVFYRVISDDKEKIFPIKDNKEAEKMMCVHQDQYNDFVEDSDAKP